MDYQEQYLRRPLVRWRRQSSRSCLLASLISIVGVAFFIAPATSQRSSYPALNTPPILYVPDRNWRISEAEQVGQIIARIRAEDAENDDLVFGLEPHFHSNYADPNDEGNNGVDGTAHRNKLPFRIDPVVGVVYLNESLIGRGGENFFLYITVSDGQLTAKNEVFVNILGSSGNRKNFGSRGTPSIANVVHNISQFLPSFDQLPGVQSIRHQQANNRPINNVPPGYNINSFFSPQRPFANRGDYIGSGFGGVTTDSQISISQSSNTSRPSPVWPTNAVSDGNDHNDNNNNNEGESDGIADSPTLDKSNSVIPTATIRTKLSPVNTSKGLVSHAGVFKGPLKISGQATERTMNAIEKTSTTVHSIQSTTIPLILGVCGFVAAAVAGFGFFFRQRLCAISKTLTKKSKAEMAKKSNQSNLSSNLTDDSRNSMVMQHWNGPMAFSNRYVPWERDQQISQQNMATSQLSTSIVNGSGIISSNVNALGVVPSGTITAPGIVGVGAVGDGGIAASCHGDGIRSNSDRWEFPRHRLKFFNILGEGAFGQVWRCEAVDIDGLEGVTTVAVKTLKENATEVEKNDLVSELQVMKSLQPHVNVVRLLGCCTEKDPLFVIIEYVNRGKLQTFLRNSRAERHYGNTHGKSNILTSGDLTSFMYQVAKGMDYLTSRGIIHRDLAARNILVTDDHTCKVADFGFARDVITSKIYERKSEGKLPIRWMAIESLYDNIFSVKSDVWSFGILMWEIVTLGSTPYPGISAADVMRKVRDGYRLEKPEHCRRELYNIMYYCWAEDANERPTFAELVQMLDKLLQTEMDYIELERFPDHNYYNILNLSGEKL